MSAAEPTLELYWDSTYAIVLSLIHHFPEQRPDALGLIELADLVERLPGFRDDPAFVTERDLLNIQMTWYEETNR